MPTGYGDPHDAGYGDQWPTPRYTPTRGANRFGRRISVQASEQSLDDLTESYRTLGTVRLRGGKLARHFVTGPGDPDVERHGLVWQEKADLTVAVYGYTDLARLRRLGEQVEPCPASHC